MCPIGRRPLLRWARPNHTGSIRWSALAPTSHPEQSVWRMCLRGRLLAMASVGVGVALSGCTVFGSPLAGDAAHGKLVAKTHCAACHGADGNSTIPTDPRLAGQKASYLYKQLTAFKDRARSSGVMAAIATSLSDSDMRDVAVFFAGQAHDSDPPGSPAAMAEGRQLFLYGSQDGSVPACAACHTAGNSFMGRGMGMGHMPMMGMMGGRRAPLLYGQHAVYVISQLKAFAAATRPATTMDQIAGAMTVQQAQAVADYVAAHP